MPVKLLSTLVISALVVMPAVASAQDTKAHREHSDEVGDGSRMICRTQNVTGSRVNSGRICMTADEWAASKRDARNRVEQEQTRRPLIDGNP